MKEKDALQLALTILESFQESGNVYDDYKADEGFTDAQYEDMVKTLKEMKEWVLQMDSR